MFQAQKTTEPNQGDDVISNDGEFWPSISISDFVRERRIPTEYDNGQKRSTLIQSMAAINIELLSWQRLQEERGIQTASACQGHIGGQSIAVTMYKNAVHSRAKALLLTHFASVNRKDEAENVGKESRTTSDELMAESQRAVRSIKNMTTASVKLI